jgi:drug/metabolite transporter (DMT)-like permease
VAASLALGSALAFAIAIVAQQRAAERVPDEHAHGARLFLQLIRSPQWVAGTVSNTAGFALQATALAYGSLLIVQPLLVTSLLFALPLGARLAHERLPRSVWVWALLLALSLAVFVTTGHPNHGRAHGSRTSWLIAACVMVPIVVAALVAATRVRGTTRASLLAIAVGILGGVLAVLTKAVVSTLRHGLVDVATSWELYGLIAVGVTGVYLQQLCFQAGALQASWPIITVLEPLVAAGLGLGLLHEEIRANGTHLILLVTAAAVMVVATVALAIGRASFESRHLAAAGHP